MTPLGQVITDFEKRNLSKFKPQKTFYQKVGINRVRFAMLVRGEKTLSIDEAKELSSFFEIPVTQLIN